MRFRPRMGNSFLDGGSTALDGNSNMRLRKVSDIRDIPVVCVECLQLREVSVERGDILCSYTPEGPDLKNMTFKDR